MNKINKSLSISFIAILSIFCHEAISQKDNQFSIDIGIPQTYKGFFYLYDGIIDLGFGYQTKIINSLYAGGSMHFEYLSRKPELGKSIFYRPSLNLNYTFNIGEKLQLIPWISGGYTFIQLSNKEFNYKEMQSGFTVTPELKLNWRTKTRIQYYIFGRYNYIYLSKDDNFTKLEYYRNIHLTSFGVGIFIKPKQYATTY